MAISEEWVEWTRSHLKNGATAAETRESLQREGFSAREIKYAFKKAVPKNTYQNSVRPLVRRDAQSGDEATDHEALSRPKLVRSTDGHNIIALCETELQLYAVRNFLSPEECNKLIRTIRDDAYPSQVDGYREQSAIRSSRTCSLTVHDHPYIAELNKAISHTLGLSLSWSEVNQGQWYEPGEQYRPHRDYFTPGTPEHTRFVNEGGQRSWTFMIYLNKPEAGGGTHFTAIDEIVMPEQGLAICWNNLLTDGQPNPNTEHAGLPVESGSKFIITKWFRDQGTGSPFVT
ncbi:prolyl hydroxylase family protein [Congregibacter sp.]|uniref:prolyl hydroxylase family protein n=1 Tax=Congregibacter sp. TaxID=2744308 RepID=UPI003F6D8A50